MNVLLLAWLFFAPQQSQLQETIDVRRTIIDAHVFETSSYQIVDDLAERDFRVLVDGKEARIESVTWVEDGVPSEEIETDENDVEVDRKTIAPPGRFFVLFVQTDFSRAETRVLGEMGVIHAFHSFLEMLQPQDRVALLSFDSHLKLRLDFSTDRQQLEKAFSTVLLMDNPPPPPAVQSPSLAALMDPHEMKYAPTSERALILLARALRRIEGPKQVLLLGWGMGERMGSGLNARGVVTPDNLRAGAELATARATVYSFNFGLGGLLRAGLVQVASDTGGFYAAGQGTNAKKAMESYFLPRVEGLLQGHYEIEIRSPVPVDVNKLHHVEVSVKRRGLTVIAKKSFVDVP